MRSANYSITAIKRPAPVLVTLPSLRPGSMTAGKLVFTRNNPGLRRDGALSLLPAIRPLFRLTSRAHLLVRDCGWTPGRYEQWVGETLTTRLLTIRCAGNPDHGQG